MVVYDRFWEYIKKNGITQYALLNQYGFTTNLIHRLKHGKAINTNTIDFICESLGCNVEDILEYKTGHFN